MPHIRPAIATDISRIANIEQHCFPAAEAATLTSFQQRFAVFPDCFFVIEADDQVVGHINGCLYHTPELPDELYADASLHCPNGPYQTVFGLAVDPDYQHRGYASLLMHHLIDLSRQHQRKGLVLTCKDHLIDFYQKCGFTCQGTSASTHGGVTWNDMVLIF